MKNFGRSCSLLVCVGSLLAFNSLAAVIHFTHSGVGAGTIDGRAFTSSPFTITAVADTSERIALYDGVLFGYWIPHGSASIYIEGVGSYAFTSPTRTFVNQQSFTVGFSRGEPERSDLFDGPTLAAFATWNMDTSIGPVTGQGQIMQWTSSWETVWTSDGILTFETAGSPATFEATVVPEPAAAALLLCGAAVVCFRRRQA